MPPDRMKVYCNYAFECDSDYCSFKNGSTSFNSLLGQEKDFRTQYSNYPCRNEIVKMVSEFEFLMRKKLEK